MDDAILDDNSVVNNAVHMSGYNSQALAVIVSQCTSQLNRLSAHQRRNLPWGQPLLLPWTLHRGGVLNAGNDCLLGKHFRRGPVKTCRGGNTCMTSSMDNRVSIPPKRFRFGLSHVRECHSYLHLIQ